MTIPNQRVVVNSTEQKREGDQKVRSLLIVLGILSVLLVGGGAGYLVYNRLSEQEVLGKVDDPDYISNIQQKQVEEILDELGTVFFITKDEQPTIATILDIEELREQNKDFYANAKEGDLLIIYSDRAIIFRRSEKKVINVAPVFIEMDQVQE